MKPLAMSTVCQTFSQYDVDTVFCIDRLHLYFDVTTSYQDLSFMLDWHKNNELLWQTLPQNIQYNKKLELYQPTLDQLTTLLDLVESNVIDDYVVQYIEFAVDFRSSRLATVNKVQGLFKKYLAFIPPRKKPHFKESHQTLYYADGRSKVRLTMYIDKTGRKDQIQKSCHVEYRIAGIKAVKEMGLYTLQQVIDFDHYQFWTDNLTLYQPIFTTMGKIAYENTKQSTKKTTVANKTYIQRGKRIWVNTLVLQELLSANIDYCQCVKRLVSAKTFKLLVDSRLRKSQYFCRQGTGLFTHYVEVVSS